VTHPSIDEILAITSADSASSDVVEHLRQCHVCHELASLTGISAAALPRVQSGASLEVVDRSLYQDRRELHRGGMGRAIRARDARLGRDVVLKELLDADDYGSNLQRERLRERFEREAAITARLQHPAIIAVYEAGRWADREPFYAMPYIRGSTLSHEISHAKTTEERLALLRHVATACDAIAYAHSKGVVHRDIKPDNILIGEFGETVVIDWGLAKDLGDDAPELPEMDGDGSLTRIGAGTAAYMCPEQAAGADVTPAFDVYALGATLYHLFAGVPPYARVGSERVRTQLALQAPQALVELAPETPAELISLTNKAMARDTTVGFASAGELADELRRFLNGQLTRTHQHSGWDLIRRWVRSHRGVVVAASVGLLIAAVVGITSVVRIEQERKRAVVSERSALHQLQRARGASASYLATRPGGTLEALELAIMATGAALQSNTPISDHARAGLSDALAAVPTAVQLVKHRGRGYIGASRDGSTLAVATSNGEVRVWTKRQAEPTKLYRTKLEGLVNFHLAPGGKTAVAHDYRSPTVNVVNLATGEVTPLRGHKATMFQTAWRTDRELVSVDRDSVIIRWDVHAKKEIGRIKVPSRISLMRATLGELAIGLLDGGVLRWDFATKKLVVYEAAGSYVVGLSAGKDGSMIGGTADGFVITWNSSGKIVARTRVAKAATVFSLSTDRTRFAVAVIADRTLVGRVSDPASAYSIPGHPTGGRTWSPDSRFLLVIHESGKASLWDAGAQALITEFAGHKSKLDRMVWLPDGLILTSGRGGAFLWDATASRTQLPGHASEVRSMSISASGDLIATCALDGAIRHWRIGHAERAVTHRLPVACDAAALSRSGRYIIAGSVTGAAKLIRVQGQLVSKLSAHTAPITRVDFTGTEDRALSASLDGSMVVWRTADASRLTRIVDPSGTVVTAAISRDGKWVASLGRDQTVRMWSATTGAMRWQWRTTVKEPVFALHFSPEGKTLLVGHGARTVMLGVVDGKPGKMLAGRCVSPHISPYSRKGERLALALPDGSVAIYSSAGVALKQLRTVERALSDIHWSVDDTQLATVNLDGTVRLWQWKTAETVLTVRARTPGTRVVMTADGARLFTAFADGILRSTPIHTQAALTRACRIVAAFWLRSGLKRYCAGRTRTSRSKTRARTP